MQTCFRAAAWEVNPREGRSLTLSDYPHDGHVCALDGRRAPLRVWGVQTPAKCVKRPLAGRRSGQEGEGGGNMGCPHVFLAAPVSGVSKHCQGVAPPEGVGGFLGPVAEILHPSVGVREHNKNG